MSKYVLNETPVKTTNGFRINNIDVDINIPNVEKFNIFNIYSNDIDKLDISIDKGENKKLNSKIGLEDNLNYKIKINFEDYIEIKDDLIIEYHFTKEFPKLTSLIDIHAGNNVKGNIIIKYISDENVYNFNYLKQITSIGDNSNLNITILPIISDESTSLISIENKIGENSKLIHNYFDLKGSTRLSNYYTVLKNNTSENYLNNIYLGKNTSIIDMNYLTTIKGIKTVCNMKTVGAIRDESKKSYKATIDFLEGAKKADGKESDNCIILSDKAESKSLPMLLCHEEDVTGSHSESSGKIDEGKLFYLMTRGLSKKEAYKVIINAEFNQIIEQEKNEELKDLIKDIINREL